VSADYTGRYEMIVGLEVHAELRTQSKMFCSCGASYGAPPNTHVCPTCLGMPGALPVLDETAVEFAVRAGLALNCTISRTSWFDRKNYYYPDDCFAFSHSKPPPPVIQKIILLCGVIS